MQTEVVRQQVTIEGFAIRQAGVEDASVLAGVIREAFVGVARQFGLDAQNCPTHPSNCDTDWVRSDFQKGKIYYMAMSAQAMGCVNFEYKDSGCGYLGRLAVLPSFRRRGVGRSLIATVEKRARSFGVRTLEIAIIAGYESLRKWYLGLGFAPVRIDEYVHLPFKVEVMTKEVS